MPAGGADALQGMSDAERRATTLDCALAEARERIAEAERARDEARAEIASHADWAKKFTSDPANSGAVELVKRITELEARVSEDNLVCLCGCPPEAHESLGEDGEQCDHEEHTCLRVAPAVRDLFVALRAEFELAKCPGPRDCTSYVGMELRLLGTIERLKRQIAVLEAGA